MSGRPVGLDQYRGSWVVVNFFATWCTGCRDEQPELRRLVADRRASGTLKILAVLHDDSAGAARTFARDHGGSWPIVDDPGDRIAQAYFVGGLPDSVLVAPDGRVQAVLVGAVRARDIDAVVNAGTEAAGSVTPGA